MEKLNPKLFFELMDVLRQGRLCDVESFGRARDVQQTSGGNEIAEMAVLNHENTVCSTIISITYYMFSTTVLDFIISETI